MLALCRLTSSSAGLTLSSLTRSSIRLGGTIAASSSRRQSQRSPRHWIQTAYRYFPLDAATLFPAEQLLPLRARAFVTLHWPIGSRHATTPDESVMLNLGIEGLSKTAFAAYFPDSEIVSERALGMVKSLIAIRR